MSAAGFTDSLAGPSLVPPAHRINKMVFPMNGGGLWPMRIAYVSVDPGVSVFGTHGASVHIQEIVREFAAQGHEVTIFTTRRGNLRHS